VYDETYERRVKLAVEALRRKDVANVSAAAATYHCSRYRMSRRMRGIGPKSKRKAHGYKFTECQENSIAVFTRRLEDIGVNLKYCNLKELADSILRDAHQSETSEPPKVGGRWAERFVFRRGIHIRRTQPIDIERKMAHDPHNIEIWFDRYRRVIERHGMLFDHVWNMDEIGFRVGIGRGDKVLALKQGKVYVPSETNRDYTTVVEAVSGRGLSVPPMVILEGQGTPCQMVHQ